MYKIKMAVRSIAYRKRQYLPLLLVCAVGIALSAFCIFIIRGMVSSLENKARIYYGGDFMIWGGASGNYELEIPDVYNTIEKMRPSFPKGTNITARFNYGEETSFIFEGVSVLQRVIIGADFENSKELFSGLTYASGSHEEIDGTNGILISLPIATKLNAKVGDEITLYAKSADGFINTAQILVKGIFQDSSLFGMYTSYMDINFLRSFARVDENWANRICISLPKNISVNKVAKKIQSSLEEKFDMFALEKTKYDYRNYKNAIESGRFIFKLVPLEENLLDLKILIDAMNVISIFIIVMLLLIIAAGISSAFRVIVMKRINEIGIYMAIGMQKKQIKLLVLYESFALVCAGSVLGFFVSFLLCRLTLNFNLSFIPAFDIFLTNGVIAPKFSAIIFFAISALICVTTLFAVLFSIRKTVSVPPVVALGMTE